MVVSMKHSATTSRSPPTHYFSFYFCIRCFWSGMAPGQGGRLVVLQTLDSSLTLCSFFFRVSAREKYPLLSPPAIKDRGCHPSNQKMPGRKSNLSGVVLVAVVLFYYIRYIQTENTTYRLSHLTFYFFYLLELKKKSNKSCIKSNCFCFIKNTCASFLSLLDYKILKI